MHLVLRIYSIRPGELDEWLREWREHRLFGYDGPEGVEAADAAYRHSPERAAVEGDSARHIAEARRLPVRAVSLG